MSSVNRRCNHNFAFWLMAFVLAFSQLATAATTGDFWKKSPELKKDLYEGRRILVSAIDVDSHTVFKGVGLVNASFEKTWAFATNPEKIKAFATDLQSFEWNVTSGDCKATFKVLWKSFLIKAKTTLNPKAKPANIGFDFVDDSWMKMKGQLEVIPHNPKQTLVILRAQTPDGQEASFKFALEAVLQRIAGSLREAVEKD